MSYVLAVETTRPVGSIALLRAGVLLEQVLLDGQQGFGAVLFGALTDLLARHGVTWTAIDLYAAATGPGSFTGVRVGVAAVKGLAEATGRPAAGISNLQALAECGTGSRRAVLLDARRGEVYGAVYSDALEIVMPEVVRPYADWVSSVGAVSSFVGLEMDRWRASLRDEVIVDAPEGVAAAVGRIAGEQGGGDPALLDANYVRRTDAELMLGE